MRETAFRGLPPSMMNGDAAQRVVGAMEQLLNVAEKDKSSISTSLSSEDVFVQDLDMEGN